MESALYGIYALVFVSEILLDRCAHSFDCWYVNNSWVNTVRQHFPWSILYLLFLIPSCLRLLLQLALLATRNGEFKLKQENLSISKIKQDSKF